jgi:hypothetical protein
MSQYNKKFTTYEMCIKCDGHCKTSGLGELMLCPGYTHIHRKKHTPDLEQFSGQVYETKGEVENG